MADWKKNAGIICEFNPMHRGHQYLIEEIRESGCNGIVAVMSGNYVQRGAPAILDKYTRAEIALKSGCDLVIELPLPFSIGSAEKFADCGVRILDSLNCIDELWFGSECGDTEKLSKITEFLISDNFSTEINQINNGNISFASAREKTIRYCLGREYGDLISKPNNILAVEYIKSLFINKSSIKPKTCQRFGTEHDSDIITETASASTIRDLLLRDSSIDGLVSKDTEEAIMSKSDYLADIRFNSRAILSSLRKSGASGISNCPDVSEGLENRIYEAACKAKSIDELYDLAKSKRYSHARIRRIVLSAYLEIKKSDFELPIYIRVLGMTKRGEKILKDSNPFIPIVHGTSKAILDNNKLRDAVRLSEACDELYGLFSKNIQPSETAYRNKMIKIKGEE